MEKESCLSILTQAKSSGDLLLKYSDLEPLSLYEGLYYLYKAE